MDLETFRQFCLSLPQTSEDMPFDESVLALRLGEVRKIFALTNIHADELSVNLKCAPDYAEYLRARYGEDLIKGAYHMNKRHWNTVYFERDEFSDEFLRDLILHSYQLVAQSLPKAAREAIFAAAKDQNLLFRLPPALEEWG